MNNIRGIKESEIPEKAGVRVKPKETPDLIGVKKLIEKGAPVRGRAIEISFEESTEQQRRLGAKPEWISAQLFALSIKRFAKTANFPVDATWRKVAESPDRYKVYVYRVARK